MTDPIADMFSRIKNALGIRADYVDIPHSNQIEKIAQIFLAEGYIEKMEVLTRMAKKNVRLKLKKGIINEIKRVSRPGGRKYASVRSLPRIQGGFGTVIVSTSKGVMTDVKAREKKLGGEILCYIW